MAEHRSSDLRPGLVASTGLHLAILAALLIGWRFAPPVAKPMQVVAVDVVNVAPVANVRAALQAPREQTAASPEPTLPSPEPSTPQEGPAPAALPPPPPAPAPEPRPVPRARPTPPPKPAPAPEPRPVPRLTPRPPPPKPKPQPKPQPKPPPEPEPRPRDLDLADLAKSSARPDRALDLSALSKAKAQKQSLDLAALSASPGKSHAKSSALDLSALASTPGGRHGGTRGAARAETARTARQAVGAGTALDADAFSALAAKIKRNWSPVCGVTVTIRILLRPDHSLAAKPTVIAQGRDGVDPATVHAATAHVLAAVEQAAPFTGLPANAPLLIPPIRFNATEGCGG